MTNENSILLIGESGVGKTHYGAQLLKRLMKGDGQLRMDGAASNLEPFEGAMEKLNEGMSADHTPTTLYIDSIWPISDSNGTQAELVWPDYGGEQIKAMSTTRRVPAAWGGRVINSPAWLLLVRLQQIRSNDDIFSKPLHDICGSGEENHQIQISDQARLIELLQVLLYVRGAIRTISLDSPRICVLLSCWDELGADMQEKPEAVLRERLPMFFNFLKSTWKEPLVLGLSALERSLTSMDRDMEYSVRGPEQFGYIVLPDGQRTSDLTFPIQQLLDNSSVKEVKA
ncbi:TRAFAC clade GTPase domain-containing protein [Pantoea agglomerans]